MDNDQDRGDLGEIPDPSWIAKWSRWSPPDIEKYIIEVANWGPLSIEQCEALIQGLPPPPKSWGESMQINPEFAASISRLKADMERGALLPCPLPEELAAWAAQVDVPLPDDFVSAVAARATERVVQTAQSVSVQYPEWVPMPKVQPVTKIKEAKRGRPKSKEPTTDALRRAARDIVNLNKKSGTKSTLLSVAKELQNNPAFSGMQSKTIKRYITGHVDTTRATNIASHVSRTTPRAARKDDR